jgi:hypothetical protein
MRTDRQRLWLVRWKARVPRAALCLTAVAMTVAATSSALRPAAQQSAPTAPVDHGDRAAEHIAQAFARAYLTWDARRPDDHRQAVEPFIAQALEPGAGLRVPHHGRQRVEWTDIVGSVRRGASRLVTVAADTGSSTTFLAVTVSRDAAGAVYVSRYPAVVGAPAIDTEAEPAEEQPLDDGPLASVARRATSNFLTGARANLLADLAPDARVALPGAPLRSVAVDEVSSVIPGRRIAVTARALAPSGARLTLRYELDVTRRAGRWLVRSIQTRPLEEPR